jgi:hypothetical protein
LLLKKKNLSCTKLKKPKVSDDKMPVNKGQLVYERRSTGHIWPTCGRESFSKREFTTWSLLHPTMIEHLKTILGSHTLIPRQDSIPSTHRNKMNATSSNASNKNGGTEL